MSVKKLLVLSAAGLAFAASSAFAGGPDVPPAPPVMDDSGVYIEANLGYAYENWEDLYAPVAVTSNGNGGFTVGGDVGYQINRNWALEFGGMYLVSRPEIQNQKLDDWFLYLGPKLIVPLGQWISNFDFFMKAGVAYRNTDVPGANNSLDLWRPFFAGGFQYTFARSFLINLQYLFLPGNNRSGNFVPDLHQFTVGLGYKFTM